MGTKSKFFRAFVSGATISDGRVITDEMIDEVFSTFNAETYSPRINVEHLAGYSPEPPFNGYGDVVAVKVQSDDFTIDGKVEKRKALYCQVQGNDQLVALVKADQKPYPSVELTPSYAGTDKVGLIGLAFTDKPASIGTQRLQFSRSAPGTVFAASSDAVTLEFDTPASDPAKVEGAVAGFFSALAATLKGGKPEKVEVATPPAPANDNFDAAAFTTQMGDVVGKSIAAAIKPITDAHAELHGQFATLQAKLEATPEKDFSRTAANGGTGEPATDC
ncbi:capsid scaffolding serine peptidase GPO [Sphingomonas sp. PP-F2F-A104-K0414]|uniref:GPO family capsid scaffolding protein n=1 Tax=Sphingomonas sp. PP-F2F-A104-K0414 TaxID=2135661 RepID=UPI00104C555C|nr:GPO family capsid scaffolding protein [Sphingomonas sp. PP-F2F-A104-K0414]TCP96971.1 capsid scaffolding serine peptidase GPO [Sphingomonas sp. PP-F2F-A104-K0414]